MGDKDKNLVFLIKKKQPPQSGFLSCDGCFFDYPRLGGLLPRPGPEGLPVLLGAFGGGGAFGAGATGFGAGGVAFGGVPFGGFCLFILRLV